MHIYGIIKYRVHIPTSRRSVNMSDVNGARDRIDTIVVLLNCFNKRVCNKFDKEKMRHIKPYIKKIKTRIRKLEARNVVAALNQSYSSTVEHVDELAEVKYILELFLCDLKSPNISKKERKPCLTIINNIKKTLRKLSITIQIDDDRLQTKNVLCVDVKKYIPINDRNVIVDNLTLTNTPQLSVQQRPTTYLYDDVWIYHNSTMSSVRIAIQCIPPDVESLTVTCTDINDDEKKHDITLIRNEQMCYVSDPIVFNLENGCSIDCGFKLSINGVSIGKVVFRYVSRGCFYTKHVVN